MDLMTQLVAQINQLSRRIEALESQERGITTPDGGFAISVIAGEALNRGEAVYVAQSPSGASGKVLKNPIDGDMPIGIVYANAVLNANVWIVVSGIAYVLPEAGITAARGYVIYSSGSAAGRAGQAATVPAATTHWREYGHWLDDGTGNGVLARAILHMN